ncbi:hypothetical protein LIER_41228 [Lithospermum erythrorhizon]|uniref:Plastocyanin-like domain-containing protein n=1 Tax=Lithospermum erythrorhizon TaxID=34254 RepID=A0AAV3R976_LITER
MHFHGHDVHVLAQGYGNYDPATARLNLVNPQLVNTVPVPLGGWAVIRFRANNPAGVFIVENGPTPETSIIPPPQDLPKC